MRLYYVPRDNDESSQWHLSTVKKINASDSKFTSTRSFADLFHEVSTIDTSSLNKERCYNFILQHVENVNAFQLLENKLYLLSATDKQGNITNETLDGIPNVEKVSFDSFEMCVEAAKALPYDQVGYIVIDNDSQDRTIVFSDEYLEAQKIRGSGSDLLYRCLTTYLKGDPSKFVQYHPRAQKSIERIENSIDDLVKRVYYAYRSRFIFKEKFTVDKTIHMILKHLHTDYYESGDSFETRKPHDIDSVRQKVLQYSPKRLHMVLKGESNKSTTKRSDSNSKGTVEHEDCCTQTE